MSDTATILDNYIAFRAKLLDLLDQDYVPDIADRRGMRWGIVKQDRRGRKRDILYVEFPGYFMREANMNGHVVKDVGDGILVMRDAKPTDVTVFLLTASMRDDEDFQREMKP
jgi:hypothetical protein